MQGYLNIACLTGQEEWGRAVRRRRFDQLAYRLVIKHGLVALLCLTDEEEDAVAVARFRGVEHTLLGIGDQGTECFDRRLLGELLVHAGLPHVSRDEEDRCEEFTKSNNKYLTKPSQQTGQGGEPAKGILSHVPWRFQGHHQLSELPLREVMVMAVCGFKLGHRTRALHVPVYANSSVVREDESCSLYLT